MLWRPDLGSFFVLDLFDLQLFSIILYPDSFSAFYFQDLVIGGYPDVQCGWIVQKFLVAGYYELVQGLHVQVDFHVGSAPDVFGGSEFPADLFHQIPVVVSV